MLGRTRLDACVSHLASLYQGVCHFFRGHLLLGLPSLSTALSLRLLLAGGLVGGGGLLGGLLLLVWHVADFSGRAFAEGYFWANRVARGRVEVAVEVGEGLGVVGNHGVEI